MSGAQGRSQGLLSLIHIQSIVNTVGLQDGTRAEGRLGAESVLQVPGSGSRFQRRQNKAEDTLGPGVCFAKCPTL